LAPQIFKAVPLWLWIPLLGGAAATLFRAPHYFGITNPTTAKEAAFAVLAVLGLIVVAYFTGKRKAALLAKSIAHALEHARRIHNACVQKSQTRHTQEIARIETESKERVQMFEQTWQTALEQAAQARETWTQKLQEKLRRTS